MATKTIIPVKINAPGPVRKTEKLTIIPTLIRKIGMNKLFPIKEMRFISAEVGGMRLLRANPARKAPIIGSIPAALAKRPEMKSIESTKIYWDPLSPSRFLKNQRLILGTPHSIRKENTDIESIILIQKKAVNEPPVAAEIKASNMSTAVSVIIVPPIVMVTASERVIPNRREIGNEINVWVEKMLAVSKDAKIGNEKI